MLAKAEQYGIAESELRRWMVVLHVEAGESKPAPKLVDTFINRM